MSTLANVEDERSEILIDTQEVKDEISLNWRIANFSKIYQRHNLEARFSLASNSTTWILKLKKTSIDLNRIDNGETVYCDLEASLVTLSKTYKNQRPHKFAKGYHFVQLLDLDFLNQLEFQDDVFKFRCNMKLSGPAMSKIIHSADYLKSTFEKLIDDFRNLLNSNQHCDVTISIGSKKIPVHKAVLCARSKVFDRMLQSDAEENKNQVIELDDLDFNIVKDFVTFLYTGKTETLSTEKAKNLYYIAGKYDVTDLREKCALYLEFNLHVDEACSVLKLAEFHKDDKLKNAVTFFIQMHGSAVKETDGWKDLVKQQPKLAFQILK